MERYCFTFRSITSAMQAQRILRQSGIVSELRRTPQTIRTNGCGYCLFVRDYWAAWAILKGDSTFQKCYQKGPDGWQEVAQ